MREASSKNIARGTVGPSITVLPSNRVTCVESSPSCRQTSGSIDGPDKRLLAQMHRFELDPHPSPSNACMSFFNVEIPFNSHEDISAKTTNKSFFCCGSVP